jgi:Cdc6-like AAA superfamily ATPase
MSGGSHITGQKSLRLRPLCLLLTRRLEAKSALLNQNWIHAQLYVGLGHPHDHDPPLTTFFTEVDEDQKLMDMLYPDFTPADLLDLCCLDSTRKDLLSDVTAWFDDISEPNVLWLSGAPGTGKTAIAWSLLAEIEKQQRSAGDFFFRLYQHAPYQLWRTMAYKMAKFHPAIKHEVYKAVTREEGVLLDDVQWTFDNLVAAPLKALDARLSNRGPILLIDGIEQCSQWPSNWQTAIDTLPQWLSLPRHCKLIVISRPQSEIEKAFEGKDIKRVELSTGDDVYAGSITENDVRTYLYHRFAEMRRQDKSISEYWPDGEAISKLVDHTRGLFKWAAIAVDDIQASGARENQLETIIEDGTTTTLKYFDAYLLEIMTIFDVKPIETFRATMGTIALSKQPLTMDDLEYFLHYRFPTSSGGTLEATCYRLLPIISIEGEKKTIKIRHKAYKDFLTDSKRCTRSDFLVDRSKAHRKMAMSCLKIMQQELKFNICGLKSSYLLNYEVVDNDMIEKSISSLLAYACQHWADHLRGIASTEKRDAEIVNLLRTFLNSHLLFWLEVLSLLSKSNIASRSLFVAADWLEVC